MEKLVILGKGNPSGQNVAIGTSARARSTYVIGITGTGKSTTLELMAYQDIANGDGLCFLDPHGDSVKKLLASVPDFRESDVIFWDPSDIDRPFGFNPFYCSDPTNEAEVSHKAQSFIDALGSLKEFASIFESAPRMKNMLHQLATTFIINQGHTLAETPKFLLDQEYREQFYPALSHRFARVRRYWEEELDARSERERREISESSLNKLERFQSDPVLYSIFGQPTNSIEFRKAMDNHAIILINLGADKSGFIGAFVVWELLQAAFSRADISAEERQPFHIFADEFQTYMTTAFPMLQAQARKYGVDTVIAHQVRAQLTPEIAEITPAVGNLIIFRVTSHNAEALASEFDTTPPPGEEVRKPITRRRELSPARYEWRWQSKETEQAYQKVALELGRLVIEADFWTWWATIGSRGNSHYWFIWMDDQRIYPGLMPGDHTNKERVLHERKNKAKMWDHSSKALFNFDPAWPSEAEFKIKQAIEDGLCNPLERYSNEFKIRGFEKSWNYPYDKDTTKTVYGVIIPDLKERQAIATSVLSELSKILLPFKQRAGAYCYDQAHSYDWPDSSAWDRGWEIKAWPAAVSQLKARVKALYEKMVETDKRMWQLAESHLKKVEISPAVYTEDVIRQEWVPGTPRPRSDVAAEIANQLTGLANYQAKVKLTQEHGRATEHLVATYDYPRIGNKEVAQRLRERSRDHYGRDREAVGRAIEERLQVRQETSHDGEEPILREKTKKRKPSPKNSDGEEG